MNTVTTIWLLVSGAYVGVASQFFVVWLRTRTTYIGIFALSAAGAAALMIMELEVIHAGTPVESGEALRWWQLPLAITFVGMVWFIRFYLQAGVLWLAWLVTAIRSVVLIINFQPHRPNITFLEMLPPLEVRFLGEALFVAQGIRSNWEILPAIDGLLFLVFLATAVAGAWHRKKRHTVVIIGCAFTVATLLAIIWARMFAWGLIDIPYFVGVLYTIVISSIFFVLSDEIVERRQLSEELRASQERMRLATIATGASLWEWNIAEDKIWLNDVGKNRIGMTAGDTLSFEEYLAIPVPEDRAVLGEAVRDAVENSGSLEVIHRVQPDGEDILWISTTGKVEYDSQGNATVMRGISLDITEKKRAAEQAKDLGIELAHLQRALSVGNISSALAHELNQPLGAILRNAEAGQLILKQPPPDLDEVDAIFSDIQYDQQRAVGIIDEMRSLLKRHDPSLEPIDVANVIAEVETLFQPEAQLKGSRIDIQIPEDLPQVLGHRVQLQQVILNLVLNSIHACVDVPESRRVITISAHVLDDGFVELAVVDRGKGIAESELARIFEPFQTTKSKGLGLGLAISRDIVERHGGSIHASNNDDGGATIRFTLRQSAS